MGQVTIYLDDENEKRLKAAAKAAGVPVSRWVASLVEKRAGAVWPGRRNWGQVYKRCTATKGVASCILTLYAWAQKRAHPTLA